MTVCCPKTAKEDSKTVET
jgi:hypothetical protein